MKADAWSGVVFGSSRPPSKSSQRKLPMTIHVRHTHAHMNTFCFKQAFIILAYTTFVWSSTLYFFGMHTSSSSAGRNFHLNSVLERNQDDEPMMLPSRRHPADVDDGRSLAKQARVAQEVATRYPSLTIFSAPKPYTGHPEDPQRRALLSWLRIVPTPKIVLLGNHSSFEQLAEEFAPHVSVEFDIDFNFMGVPQFHSMIARAQASNTDLSMLINGDIILLNDLMPAVVKMNSHFSNWVLTCQRWDVDGDFPFSFEAQSRVKDPEFDLAVKQYAQSRGVLHTYGGVDFWVWNNSPAPLLKGVIPPFVFGRGKYDNWFMHEIIASGNRQVIDASDSITSIHVAHNYQHVPDSSSKTENKDFTERFSFWSTRKKSSWELFTNIHLAQSFGSYKNQMGTAMHAPWRLASCHEPSSGNICLLKRIRPANCSCEYSSYARQTLTDSKVINNKWVCGSVSIDKESDYSIPTTPSMSSTEGLPHTMLQLLPKLAKTIGKLKVVTLVAVSSTYSHLLMNFVCRLRMLNLADNLIVAALDETLYRFAYTQGLPVYLEDVSQRTNGMQAECPFGTQCFREFTKLKSKAVLRVLEAGYSVLWSDVDIVWFSDPLPNLISYGAESLPIQSNEPDGKKAGTGIRRINSGFYFARSEPRVIKAFREIVAHAASSRLSEQPSFYDVLCGLHGENVIKRREMCKWQRRLRVIFLDRKQYPNGAVHSIWSSPNVTARCQELGCIILHNNWISGMQEKQNRLTVNGFWHYDEEKRMCMYDWYKKK